MENKAIVVFKAPKRNIDVDLEIPLDVSAKELVLALNEAYQLEIDEHDATACYMKAEKPIALLKGNKLLSDFGVRNGTVIYFTE